MVGVIILILAAASVRPHVPKNIFSFQDIGTYRIPPQSVEVNEETTYGQSIVSNFNNLFMMTIFIPTQNLNKDRTLYFHLKRNKEDSADLIKLKWKFNQISPKKNNFYLIPSEAEITKKGFHFCFQFPVIKNTKYQSLYFYFEAPDAKKGDGLKIGYWDKWYNQNYYEALTAGASHKNHAPMPGFLAFRTFHTVTARGTTLINEIKSRLLKDKAFLIVYVTCLALLFLLTMKNVASARR